MVTGRNDPCPCGSGKKYKRCCLEQDQVLSLAAARYDRAYTHVLVDLGDFAVESEAEMLRATAQFFGDQEPDGDPAETTMMAFLDWLAFNYRDAAGQTVLARFRARAAAGDATEQELLAAWQGSRPGLYRVEDASSAGVRVRDLATSQDYVVVPPRHARRPDGGDLLLTRLLPVGAGHRFGQDLRAAPGHLQPALVRALHHELERLRCQDPAAGWDDLFAGRWPALLEVFELQAAVELHAKVGTDPRPPQLPRVRSLGRLTPPADASPFQQAGFRHLERYIDTAGLTWDQGRSLSRLWWDMVAHVQPRQGKAEGWAAGTAYCYHYYCAHDGVTQADVARTFGVSPATVSQRSWRVTSGLRLEVFDARYADALDPRVREDWIDQWLGVGAPTDAPALVSGPPEAALAAERLNAEGQSLLQKRKWTAAASRFRQALEICPSAIAPRNNLALVHRVRGRNAQALAEAEAVLDDHPENVFALALAGTCRAEQGDTALAWTLAQRALDCHQRQRRQEGLAAGMFGDPRAAIQRLTELFQALAADNELLALVEGADPQWLDSSSLWRAGLAALRLGRFDAARRWLRRSQDAEPGATRIKKYLQVADLIEQDRIPAIAFDYGESVDDLAPGDKHVNAAVCVMLATMIWHGSPKDAEDGVAIAGRLRDPWTERLLWHLLTQPDLPDRRKSAAFMALGERGLIRPGQEVIMHVQGRLRPMRFEVRTITAPAAAATALHQVQRAVATGMDRLQRLADQQAQRLFQTPLPTPAELEQLLALRTKAELLDTARCWGMTRAGQLAKAELARMLAARIEADPAAALQPLSRRQLDLLKWVLERSAAATVPWTAVAARWGVERHPAMDRDGLLYQPWCAGLIHIGTVATAGPAGGEVVLMVPATVAQALRGSVGRR